MTQHYFAFLLFLVRFCSDVTSTSSGVCNGILRAISCKTSASIQYYQRDFCETPIMTQRSVETVVTAHQQREGGGFMVRRPIGGKIKNLDPFLMLDHMGPVDYGKGEALGAPDHPHRGFETVTYVIDGGFHHKDSAGNEGELGPGWVQWMTAGSGVVHSEMPSKDLLKNGGRSEGFQLWVNLPATDKFVAPRYQDTPPEKIPVARTSDGRIEIKVLAGEALRVKSPIQTRFPIFYLDIRLQPGASYSHPIPASHQGFAYIWRGSGYLGHDRKRAEMGQVGRLSKEGQLFEVSAAEDKECFILLVGGTPLNEPIVQYGPFVMNTQEQIQQAIDDYRAGKLGQIPGAEKRYAQTKESRKLHHLD